MNIKSIKTTQPIAMKSINGNLLVMYGCDPSEEGRCEIRINIPEFPRIEKQIQITKVIRFISLDIRGCNFRYLIMSRSENFPRAMDFVPFTHSITSLFRH